MPPTRGHDLKHKAFEEVAPLYTMPPTRGHDLKLPGSRRSRSALPDAPHTGARLETLVEDGVEPTK